MTVSIRGLTISLALACVALTAVICMLLALTSADEAIDDVESLGRQALDETRTADKQGLNTCFNVTDRVVRSRTEALLDALSVDVIKQVTAKVAMYVSLANKTREFIQAIPRDEFHRWERFRDELIPTLASDFKAFRPSSLSAAGVTSYDKKTLLLFHNITTTTPDILVVFNNGSGLTGDASCGRPCPEPKDRNVYGILTGDLQLPSGPCRRQPWGEYVSGECGVQITDPLYPLAERYIPLNEVKWSPISSQSQYIGMLTIAPFHHPGATTLEGIVYYGVEVRDFSNFLSSVKIGGGSRHRVFVTVGSDWVANKLGPLAPLVGYTSQVGLLIGVSDGLAYRTEVTTDYLGTYPQPFPINDVNATDPIIRGAARAVAGDYARYSGGSLPVMLDTETGEPGCTEGASATCEQFFMKATRVVLTFESLDWWVVTLVDKEYVLGEVNRMQTRAEEDIRRSDMAVQAKLAEDRAETQDALDRKRMILYITVSFVALALVIVSMVLVHRITSPLKTLEKEMSYVALMKLEMVETNRPPSLLDEVRNMQSSFYVMTACLRELRNYMPQSVLQDNDEEEDDEGPKAIVHETIESISKSGSSRGTSLSSTCSTALDGERGVGGAAASLPLPTAARKRMDNKALLERADRYGVSELKSRRVTFAMCNLVGWMRVIKSGQLSAAIRVLTGYLEEMLRITGVFKGIVDGFNGDRVFFTWNGAKPVTSHATKATQAAMRMKDVSLNGLPEEAGAVSPSVAISNSECKCGNMGCEGMKRFTYFGTAGSWVHTLERLNAVYNTPVLCDQDVQRDISGDFLTHPIDYVLDKLGRHVVVWTVRDIKRAQTEQEWMYQLQEFQENDPNRTFTQGFFHYIDGRYDEAEELLEKAVALEGVTPEATRILDACREYRDREEPPPPRSLFPLL